MSFAFTEEESSRFLKIIEEFDSRSQEKYLIYQASTFGHLECIAWMTEVGCKLDGWVMAHAAWKGHLELVKWLKWNGCPCDGIAISWAENSGHHTVVKWLRENGCSKTM